jgi:hypothetical protein
VADFFKNNQAVKAQSALAISGQSGNIYFRSSYVNSQKPERVAALLTHELLHNLGFDDTDLQRALGLPIGAASENITKKFYDDCFKK